MTASAAQYPLIQIVESDDLYLEGGEPCGWFRILHGVDWTVLRVVAARYYEALWQFNVEQQRRRERRMVEVARPNPETRAQATVRLLFERPTLCGGAAPLYEVSDGLVAEIRVDPARLEPGQVPLRIAGRQPKCFFALVKAFLGMLLRGRPAEPEIVYDELHNNPAYARACGFTLPDRRRGYRHSDTPSLRKLEQFDQIMTAAGLWHDLAVEKVRGNLREGLITVGITVVHDTTHYPARSAMTAVEIPDVNQALAPQRGKQSRRPKKGQRPASKGVRRKSHPRTIKTCRCAQPETCPHPWVSADQGAGTVCKSGGKRYWAHKASTIGIPGQEVLLDAVAMSDAAGHDSTSLEAHIERLLGDFPELAQKIEWVLDDAAADDEDLKIRLIQRWGIVLMTPINPRGRKKQTKDLPRGVQHIEPAGIPVCRQGFPFDFVGVRHEEQRFLFRAPDMDGVPVCTDCSVRAECYRGENGARQVSIPFERLPWINPGMPELSLRFREEMANRTVIERLHKLMKEDFGDERLSKRGNAAFQARLDKTRWAMHVLLAERKRR
jgi:hypothetical protein